MLRELPPTAGLPLRACDLLPFARQSLPRRLGEVLEMPTPLLTSSGTAALLIALHALRAMAPSRSVVIAPAFTCPLVALAIAQAGLTPRLCDLAPESFELDLQQLQGLCDAQTLAVIPTHLGGRVADVAAVNRIASAQGAWVIEDAAQALGARADGASVGLAGDIALFSLGVGKGLTIWAGGLLVAREPALREALATSARALARPRRGQELRQGLLLAGYAACYRPLLLPWVYGMPLRRALARGDVIGALEERFAPTRQILRVGRWREGVGARAAARLPAHLARSQERALRWREALQRIDGIEVLGDRPHALGTWPYLLVKCATGAQRDRALSQLWRAGLGVSRAFAHALPDYPQLAGLVRDTDVPRARDFAARTLTLGNSPWLDEKARSRINAALGAAAAA